jgi:5-methylcytosine-specific restriction endonuclease McrA
MCKRNPDPDHSPGGFRLPLDEDQIEAAKAVYRENKGAQWSAAVAIGLQVDGNAELRDSLVAFFVELVIPTATIADAFCLSGREVWEIASSDPISMFCCLDCDDPIEVRDRKDLVRLRRALRTVSAVRPGDLGDMDLLCESCTGLRLQIHNEEQRLRRLARQSRAAQLRKMPFSDCRLTPEWQARRVAALARGGYRCQTCGENDARLEVHHNTYERYGDESFNDLIVLCARCHQLFHEIAHDAAS